MCLKKKTNSHPGFRISHQPPVIPPTRELWVPQPTAPWQLCPSAPPYLRGKQVKVPTGTCFSCSALIISKVSFLKNLVSSKSPLKGCFFSSTEWTLLHWVFNKHNILCKQFGSEGHNPSGTQNLQLSLIFVLTTVESKIVLKHLPVGTQDSSFFFLVVVQSLSHIRLFATPWTTAQQAPLSFTISWSWLKLMTVESVILSNHLILCQPLLLLPSVLPSIRLFSNESFLFRWPEYWNFSFSISSSNEYSTLISFRSDWFDLLAVFLGTIRFWLRLSTMNGASITG